MDRLNGGGGNDNMSGGAGNDTYFVDAPTDRVTENLNSGTDLIESAVTYTLPINVERLTLTGGTAINGTGNTLNNTLTGNTGNNRLDGGVGVDGMTGGDGNDTYVVDHTSDTVTEAAGGGTADLVESSVTYTLDTTGGANVENLTLTGGSFINGTGNALANTLTGNTGNNTLNGDGDNDTLNGNAGNDILNGGAGNDTLNGGIGNDILNGNAGQDGYTGGAGNDTFVFSLVTDLTDATGTTDTIADFSRAGTNGTDKINLAGIFGGNANFIGTAAFAANADNEVRISSNAATGTITIEGDNNTDTAPEFVIQVTLSGTVTGGLQASDFVFA